MVPPLFAVAFGAAALSLLMAVFGVTLLVASLVTGQRGFLTGGAIMAFASLLALIVSILVYILRGMAV